MMKKLVLIFGLLLMSHSFVFADEIIDSKGNIIPCKVTNIADDFVEYQKNGCSYSFTRESSQSVFNDYVDVNTGTLRNPVITRFSGRLIFRDMMSIRIRNNDGDQEIPWYKVRFVGIYKPN